ncbi:hypothetical protein QTN25_005045 [Entamoeba marina]
MDQEESLQEKDKQIELLKEELQQKSIEYDKLYNTAYEIMKERDNYYNDLLDLRKMYKIKSQAYDDIKNATLQALNELFPTNSPDIDVVSSLDRNYQISQLPFIKQNDDLGEDDNHNNDITVIQISLEESIRGCRKKTSNVNVTIPQGFEDGEYLKIDDYNFEIEITKNPKMRKIGSTLYYNVDGLDEIQLINGITTTIPNDLKNGIIKELECPVDGGNFNPTNVYHIVLTLQDVWTL